MSAAQTSALRLRASGAPCQTRDTRARSTGCGRVSTVISNAAQGGAVYLSSRIHGGAILSKSRSVRASSRSLAVAVAASASVPAGSVSVLLLAGAHIYKRIRALQRWNRFF